MLKMFDKAATNCQRVLTLAELLKPRMFHTESWYQVSTVAVRRRLCVCVSVRVCTCVCAHACMHVTVFVCQCTYL
jgi:hypothetical protein